MVTQKDREIIRDLAKKYLEICNEKRNLDAIELWSKHNSLIKTRPPVYTSCFFASDFLLMEIDEELDKNKTESLQFAETWFKRRIWHSQYIKDDSIFDPWFPMESQRLQAKGLWGFDLNKSTDNKSHGYRFMPKIKSFDDLKQLEATPHVVIEREPIEVRMMRDAISDILPVHVKYSTSYDIWGGTDLSEALGKLVGMEEYMLLLYDNPELIHAIMSFMRDAVLNNLEKGEKDGDWSTADGCSYTFIHTKELPSPRANSYGANLKDLWFFTHAQEFESVGNKQHEEFLLNYQMPIMEKFGLVSYGCCETLDKKIDMLRKIPNLRRICIGPRADVKHSAEQIGSDYILSWRPNPSMVSLDFDLGNCREIVKQGFKDTQGCSTELMLKEMMTVQGDLSRLTKFTNMALIEAESIGI